ncbi:MAG: DMT family transporter [Chloroflexi bacterium]|nr:DMT family transporter [Chloroflexota bacterium]
MGRVSPLSPGDSDIANQAAGRRRGSHWSGSAWPNITAIGAFSLFGGAVVATRVVAQDIPPFTLAAVRIGIGAAILWALVLLFHRHGMRVERRDWRLFFLLAAFYFTAFPLAMAFGFQVTEASRGALLMATSPVWSVALGRIFGRESLDLRQIAGVVVSLIGIGLVFGETALSPAESGGETVSTGAAIGGAALLLFAAACVAVYGVASQRAFARYSAMNVTAWTMLIGALMLAPLALAEAALGDTGGFDTQNTLLMLYLGSLGLAQLMFVFSLTRLSPTQVVVYVNFNPLVAMALGAALLEETLTGAFAVGAAAVIAGAVLVNWPKR